MEIKIKSKYLIFPVNKEAAVKQLKFLKEGKEVYGLNVRLDNIQPDFFAYVDVERFMGDTLELTIDAGMPIRFT